MLCLRDWLPPCILLRLLQRLHLLLVLTRAPLWLLLLHLLLLCLVLLLLLLPLLQNAALPLNLCLSLEG